MKNDGVMAWLGGTLAFATEIAMLVAFGMWGFAAFDGALGWVVGIGLPLVVATLWGVFLAPKASRPIAEPAATLVRAALFLTSAVALYAAGLRSWAFILVGVTVAGLALSAIWPLRLDSGARRS